MNPAIQKSPEEVVNGSGRLTARHGSSQGLLSCLTTAATAELVCEMPLRARRVLSPTFMPQRKMLPVLKVAQLSNEHIKTYSQIRWKSKKLFFLVILCPVLRLSFFMNRLLVTFKVSKSSSALTDSCVPDFHHSY